MAVTIGVRNFGPIERADLVIRPLTVFVGPNNAGKSVLAMLTYAVMQAVSTQPGVRAGFGTSFAPSPRRVPRMSPEVAENLATIATDRLEGPERPLRVRRETAEWVDQHVALVLASFARTVLAQIERSFSTRLEGLWRVTRRAEHPFSLDIRSDDPDWRITIEAAVDGEQRITIKKQPKARVLVAAAFERVEKRYLRYARDIGDLNVVTTEFRRHLAPAVMREFPSESYYLPAERSGILQSHRQLASFVVRQSPLVGIEDLQVPRMSGVVSDFISNLLQLDSDEPGGFAGLAYMLEQRLLEGHIEIQPDATGYPDVSYAAAVGTDFPLHRASSMVSEIAPIVLYLRFLLDPGEFFIIEEPESHLHPRSQLALAEAVSYMVSGGLGVLLTTHSDYFLSQLNNAIRLHAVAGQQSFDLGDGPAIAAETVAAYLFMRDGAATRVLPLEVTPDEGVSEEEFGRVAEELYDRTVRLEQALGQDD